MMAVNTAYSRVVPEGYAQRKASGRLEASRNLAGRVTRPVVTTVEQESRPAGAASGIGKTLGYMVGGGALHAGVIGLLLAFGAADQTVAPVGARERMVIRSVDPVILPEAASMAEEPLKAEIEPVVEPQAVAVDKPISKKPSKKIRKRVKPLSADPVDLSNKEVTKERRRIVGLSLSSTVSAGKGPSFAIGNTRMGKTARVAKVEKAGRLGADDVNDNRTGKGGDSPNRVATAILTDSAKVEKPRRIDRGGLDYPEELKARGIEGNVVVLVVIDTDGRVQKVRVIKSSGYPQLDEAAKIAAKRALYSPAKKDGEPVEYNLKYTYRFRIKGA